QGVLAAEPAVLARAGATDSGARARAAAEAVAGDRRPAEAADDRIAERVIYVAAGTGLGGDRGQRRVELHPAGVAADLTHPARLDLDRLGEQRARLARDQHRVTGLAGGGLDAGAEVDGVADHAEGEPPRAADRAGDDVAAVDPDADLEAAGPAAGERPGQLDRGLRGASGVLLA